VAVIGHEMYELEMLRSIFGEGASVEKWEAKTSPNNPGNFHWQAWDSGKAGQFRYRQPGRLHSPSDVIQDRLLMADSPRARDVTVQDVKYSPSRSASNCSWYWRTILKLPSLSISDLSRFPLPT
jgi:hypothetical protein